MDVLSPFISFVILIDSFTCLRLDVVYPSGLMLSILMVSTSMLPESTDVIKRQGRLK